MSADYSTQHLYDALAYAETGGEADPYIRTRVRPKGGSTAFGPVQITKTLAQDYAARGLLSKESQAYYTQVLQPLYQQFIRHGGNAGKKGYDPAYDYGGRGNFDPAAQGSGYKRLAEELISSKYSSSKKDVDAFIRSWRGADDPAYTKKVKNKLSKALIKGEK